METILLVWTRKHLFVHGQCREALLLLCLSPRENLMSLRAIRSGNSGDLVVVERGRRRHWRHCFRARRRKKKGKRVVNSARPLGSARLTSAGERKGRWGLGRLYRAWITWKLFDVFLISFFFFPFVSFLFLFRLWFSLSLFSRPSSRPVSVHGFLTSVDNTWSSHHCARWAELDCCLW